MESAAPIPGPATTSAASPEEDRAAKMTLLQSDPAGAKCKEKAWMDIVKKRDGEGYMSKKKPGKKAMVLKGGARVAVRTKELTALYKSYVLGEEKTVDKSKAVDKGKSPKKGMAAGAKKQSTGSKSYSGKELPKDHPSVGGKTLPKGSEAVVGQEQLLEKAKSVVGSEQVFEKTKAAGGDKQLTEKAKTVGDGKQLPETPKKAGDAESSKGQEREVVKKPKDKSAADVSGKEKQPKEKPRKRSIDYDEDDVSGDDVPRPDKKPRVEEPEKKVKEVKPATPSRKGMKKGEGVKDARTPGAALKRFKDNRYVQYDWDRDAAYEVDSPGKFKGSYEIFDDFKLLTGDLPPGKSIGDLPTENIRLDDRWAGMMVSKLSAKQLCTSYPGEFDSNGMLRATRMPLGEPCLIWAKEGHKDMDDQEVPEDGLFYGWYKGLQILCGSEGFDDYQVRPSFEKLRCKTVGFKVDHPRDGSRQLADYKTEIVDGKTVVVLK